MLRVSDAVQIGCPPYRLTPRGWRLRMRMEISRGPSPSIGGIVRWLSDTADSLCYAMDSYLFMQVTVLMVVWVEHQATMVLVGVWAVAGWWVTPRSRSAAEGLCRP